MAETAWVQSTVVIRMSVRTWKKLPDWVRDSLTRNGDVQRTVDNMINVHAGFTPPHEVDAATVLPNLVGNYESYTIPHG